MIEQLPGVSPTHQSAFEMLVVWQNSADNTCCTALTIS
jgi:hypothetical protein